MLSMVEWKCYLLLLSRWAKVESPVGLGQCLSHVYCNQLLCCNTVVQLLYNIYVDDSVCKVSFKCVAYWVTIAIDNSSLILIWHVDISFYMKLPADPKFENIAVLSPIS